MIIKTQTAIPDLYKVIHSLEIILLKLLDKELSEYNKNNLVHRNTKTKAPLSFELESSYDMLTNDLTDYKFSGEDKEYRKKRKGIFKKHGISI